MSTRLATGGRLIDHAAPMTFTFNGKEMQGYAGDTLASALLANDQMLVGRSFKYHRPRGIMASGAEEPNALVGLGRDGQFEPNQRATTTELFDGLESTSQNHWPSLDHDIGAVNQYLGRVLPAGFYYKMFLYPRAFWKHVYEPFIRHSAGLGKAPQDRDADSYEHFHVHVDVLVIGGGIAGLQAACAAGRAGAKVLLIEQTAHWGGRAPVDGGVVDGISVDAFTQNLIAELDAMENVTMRLRTMGAGVYDHGYVLGYERRTDHAPDMGGPRHRLWRIRAARTITATGAIERPLSFSGNDIPGVMLASAVRDYAVNFGVAVGDRTLVVTNNDDGYRTAIALKNLGLDVPAVIDARPAGGGALAQEAASLGIRIETGKAVAKALGGKRITGAAICAQAGTGSIDEEIECDCIAMSGGWSPVVHLWSHCGGKLIWDADHAFFRPDPARPPLGAEGQGVVMAAGSANGALDLAIALADADYAGRKAAEATGYRPKRGRPPEAEQAGEAPILPVWQMPEGADQTLRAKTWLDFQNDVKVTDVQLAAREGFESVEHTKRYTTLGMATDQGKLSNINGLAVLSEALGQAIPATGTTTFRPPYTPISMGAIAGEARGDLFQPLRRTPMHEWHEANGAEWEPVGQWRRPYCYIQGDETPADAVTREVTAVRQSLGLLDASTLGKIIVKGPDAGRFLDMMYTNMMSNLGIGKCRYGLMCNENGFLIDDGVVARIDADTWLCHTTTGGADHIHAHMEEWLQTEWWDWQVYTANVTEQWAQIAVVGPNARNLLEKFTDDDLSAEAFPFMTWKDVTLNSVRARVFRISFSGELSYEVATPAGMGRAVWNELLAGAEEFGATTYGTEALHVLRAEKGFIMIGDETDGTVTPQDLCLNWAVSKKKHDFIGKRGQQRSHLCDPTRWRLVGLQTLDGSVLPDGAYAATQARNANGQRKTIGRVTSTYYSPTLKRGIAMGLVENGPQRMGEVIDFPMLDGTVQQVRIVDPVQYDKAGEKQNV